MKVLEKKIESLHITRSMKDRAEQLSKEIDEVNENVNFIIKCINIAQKEDLKVLLMFLI